MSARNPKNPNNARTATHDGAAVRGGTLMQLGRRDRRQAAPLMRRSASRMPRERSAAWNARWKRVDRSVRPVVAMLVKHHGPLR